MKIASMMDLGDEDDDEDEGGEALWEELKAAASQHK